jgi:hypothetical protein
MTVLPQSLATSIKEHLGRVRKLPRRIGKPATARSLSPLRFRASIQVRHASGHGSMRFPPARARWIRVPGWCAGTMRTRSHCRGRCTRLCDGRALLNWPRRIRCDIRSPPTSCNRATTSERCRSFSASSMRRSRPRGEARTGVLVIDVRTGDTSNWMRSSGVVTELYDVVALPGVVHPTSARFSPPRAATASEIPPSPLPLASPRGPLRS